MDISFPLTATNGSLTLADDTLLNQQRVFTQIVTVRGERRYRPGYGVRQSLFMNPGEYPQSIADVMVALSFDSDGTLEYLID